MSTISAELTSGFTVRVTNGRHTWFGDEPRDAGGADQGPNPYELLLGALAACTCITVSMYCQRKGWKLDAISVDYTHDRVHAEDCDDCDQKPRSGYLDRVRSRIFIDGEFTDEQRARLREVAQRCPVHKTLDQGMTFTTEEVHAG